VHASLLTAAVVATLQSPRAHVVVSPPDTIIYVAPPRPAAPVGEANGGCIDMCVQVPPIKWSPSPAIPGVDVVPNSTVLEHLIGGGASLIGSASPEGGPPDGIFTEATVDRIVMPRRDNPQPEYPRRLRAAGLDGSVVARFVVDTAGRVERGSIEILQATHGLFADAVREWLPRTGYSPAESAGRRVRQLVEQRIAFTLR
jgi:protein TonB